MGIIGPNGAGKTTFFNAISGVQSLSSGRLVAEGRDLTGKRANRFAAHGVARTFQTPRTFAEMTVRDNIQFGLQVRRPPAAQVRVLGRGGVGALGAAHGRQHPQADRPGRAGRRCRPRPSRRSQQRLLEIGMALATRPRLLLLDEVAAGLTEGEIEDMARLIRRMRDELDLTVIWIEHAVTVLLRHVERVIVLHQGRKIADGRRARWCTTRR